MIIVMAVIIGVVVGILIVPFEWIHYTDLVMDIGICMLLLLVGIDIGKQKGILAEIKKLGKSLIIIPILIGAGSIVGGVVSGVILGMPLNEGAAIGAGFGWYSLSAVILSDYSNALSAMAFLTNVIRELLAIMLIPILAKWLNYESAIAPSGATAMDTTLPIINRYTDAKTGVLAFVTGVILSTLVPILVPLMIRL